MVGTEIALSLALGAGAVAGSTLVSEVVKSAYKEIKDKILGSYPDVSIDALERNPASESRRGVLAEELEAAGAVDDTKLRQMALELLRKVEDHAPQVAQTIGVEVSDVHAAGLAIHDVTSTGSGVRITRTEIDNNIRVSGVRAGGIPESSSQEEVKKNYTK